ncbi:MAG: PadR family transcriptional regulator [Catenulispora sp.]|nr:PadR family transcriptional regulator [Catenulispora sp.]
MSSLRYALLCALHAGPLTGYEIVQRMRRPIGYSWTAQQSQIYPELARLTDEGLIEHEAAAGPGPHERRTHRLTPAGQAELGAWLVRPPQHRAPKDELVLKTYAVAAADPVAMRELYATEARRHAERLADYEGQHEAAVAAGHDRPGHPRFGAYATLQLGILSERALLSWCGWMAEQIDTGAVTRHTEDSQDRGNEHGG